MVRFKVTKYSHGFKVRVLFVKDRSYIFGFVRQYTQMEMKWNPQRRRNMMSPTTVYATSNPDRSEFGFLLRDIPAFEKHMEISGIRPEEIAYEKVEAPEGVPIEFSLPVITPRDNQSSALRFMKEDGKHIRVLPLPTGQGKTLTTFMHLAERGTRTVFFMRAGHLKTWLDTIVEHTDIDKEDIVVIRGTSNLRALIATASLGRLHAKVILISSETFNGYLNTYIRGEMVTGNSFDVTPDKFIELIGAGASVTDECHELLHHVVRRAIMLNVMLNIYLSATLKSGRELTEKIYGSVFPMEDRFTDFKNNDHIVVHPTYYTLREPSEAKYQGDRGYSHLIYEGWLFGDKERAERYLDVIYSVIKQDYLENRKPGTKLLVFAATVDACEKITAYLNKKLDDSITVSTYVAATPEEVLDEFEVIVTTPKSCGTGTDIPNLSMTLMTVAVGGIQLSEQILGRTRPIKLYPDEDPRFYYLTAANIPKHMDYDRAHIREFKDKSKFIKPVKLPAYV